MIVVPARPAKAAIAECFPILTQYIWEARENGARVIVVDPRITPLARTCDLFLPVKPGRDIALFNGILHLMIENDWLDHEFIESVHGLAGQLSLEAAQMHHGLNNRVGCGGHPGQRTK